MEGEEGVQKLFEADLLRVVLYFDHLGVAGLVGANVLVAGPLQRTAFIAHSRRRHAGDGREGRLDTPKTPRSKDKMRFGCFGKQILLAAEKLCVIVNSNSTGGEDDGLALFSCT